LKERSREASVNHRNQIQKELNVYHKHLLTNLLSSTAHCELKVLTDVSFVVGFSEIQIQQVLDNVEHLFNINDICNSVEIWDIIHAHKILQILSDTFQDIDECNWSEVNRELENDMCFDEWNTLLDDDEMLNMAVDNLTLEEYYTDENTPQLEDTFNELETSEANDSLDAGIPDLIHETLERMDLSHD